MTTQDVREVICQKFEVNTRKRVTQFWFLEQWDLSRQMVVYAISVNERYLDYKFYPYREYSDREYMILVLHTPEQDVILREFDRVGDCDETSIDRVYLSRSGKSIMAWCECPDYGMYTWDSNIPVTWTEQYQLKDYLSK